MLIIFGPKIFWLTKVRSKKLFESKKYLAQIKVWYKKMWYRKIKPPKKLEPKILVIIGEVIAEILLIRANVNMIYVAWTNVTLNVGIC